MEQGERIQALRAHLSRISVDGFLLPMSAPHYGDYIPEWDRRIAWLSGFSGSAGFCIILQDRAALFVDGRYETQAKNEVDTTLWQVIPLAQHKPLDWLAHTYGGKIERLAYDPWLTRVADCQRYEHFVPLTPNPVDAIWKTRPPVRYHPLMPHALGYAGIPVRHKKTRIRKKMQASSCLITAVESVAWLTNTRGNDFPYTPCGACFALATASKIILFLHPDQNPTVPLEASVEIRSWDDIFHLKMKEAIQIDPKTCPIALEQALLGAGCTLVYGEDPCLLPKSIKNSKEISGARKAHIWDGIALTEFLADLENDPPSDEMEAVQHLEKRRQKFPAYLGPSFPTIAAFGAHSAIIHYHPTQKTNVSIVPNNLFLIDSGGQYKEGTTDCTRTVCIGQPTRTQKHHYTLVLKAHISLARTCFPKGTTGAQLDGIARFPLWQEGLDYAHGTGHGVGSYLSVHEGPQSISYANAVPFEAGMIISNEPGYYLPEHYGIRLESLMLTVAKKNGFLGFEILTLAPFDWRLIEWTLLSSEEQRWIYHYHVYIYKSLRSKLSRKANQYMENLWI